MPTHAKMPSAMKREMCAHGGPMQCDMGCYSKGGKVDKGKLLASAPDREGAEKNAQRYLFDKNAKLEDGHGYSIMRGSGSPFMGVKVHEKGGRYRMEDHRHKMGPGFAEGGDVEPLEIPMEGDGHEEIEHALADELLSAMEKKDKQGVVDAIEALVMQCMSKGGSDV